MRKLFESFRNYNLLTEDQLLVEGRKQDAAKRYPGLAKKREELDGESLLDVLIDKDPSGNQKYLMRAAYLLQRSIEMAEQNDAYYPFYGKQWPEDADDNLYSPWGVANNIANQLSKYHKLTPFLRGADEKFKDFDKIESYSQLQQVTDVAQQKKDAREREKKAKAEEKRVAKETSTEIDNNDHHLVIRPLSAEASCYYGQRAMGSQVRWCISAERSRNYFDQYTSDGKSFYFLLAKRKNVEPAYKKIAMVVDRDGSVDEYYDSEDDTMRSSEFRDAIRQIMVGPEVSGRMVSLEEREPYKKDAILDGLEEWKGINGFDFDREDHEDEDGLLDLVMMFNDFIVEEYIKNLHNMAQEDTQNNPAGTPDEEYEELLSTYSANWNHIDVSLSFPYDTGHDKTLWESNLWLDVESYIHPATGYEFVPGVLAGEMEEELRSAVDAALNNIDIWPEELEQETWGDQPGTQFRIRVQDGGGPLDEFEQFLEEQNVKDTTYSEHFAEYLRDMLEDEGVVVNPEKVEAEKEAERQKTRDAEYWPDPEEKKKQIALPLQENKRKIRILFKS
jgi:hypothetical protein